MYLSLGFLLLAFCQLSLQQGLGASKKQMTAFREDAERRMRTALGERVQGSVLRSPLRRLTELESAGKGDLTDIASFGGSGDKEAATRGSLRFWQGKMEEVISPYVTHPERYRGLIIDHVFLPEDPTWNTTTAYKKIEKELNTMSEKSIKKLQEELKRRVKPAGRLEDVTENNWKKLEGQRALDNGIFLISLSRQFAKNSAAGGENKDEYMNRFTDAIESASKEFYDKINIIYK